VRPPVASKYDHLPLRVHGTERVDIAEQDPADRVSSAAMTTERKSPRAVTDPRVPIGVPTM
jgi:hypothetical protein